MSLNTNWWAKTSASMVVNTVLYIADEHGNGAPERNIQDDIRVGTSTANVMLNTVCISTLNFTGWYQCPTPLTGTVVSINS